jgi:hypothetical protein
MFFRWHLEAPAWKSQLGSMECVYDSTASSHKTKQTPAHSFFTKRQQGTEAIPSDIATTFHQLLSHAETASTLAGCHAIHSVFECLAGSTSSNFPRYCPNHKTSATVSQTITSNKSSTRLY